ncbi:glycosyltransferase [Roseovarius sp. LXJ103]|uniref:glycosyltransferase family 2 protein n=1 Tax=Roseovarius carneus TaxID=2853164 RepID=UPI000D61F174|nr:glycosyltransferase [Roseovarius carneus]MBZ8119290.1 glycosyltransferase [Roseovarius carneus]PWE35091.1 glycosyl transferase [Pelagicola sp. LXJ1103]
MIPAHDEAGYIAACLGAVFASRLHGREMQVMVIANACTDDTVARARAAGAEVIETAQGGKLHALGLGDAAARHDLRVYLDADVVVSPDLLAQIADILDVPAPRYASGTPIVTPAQSFATRAYARFWQSLPFVQTGVPGFGIFAVNTGGRARWRDWPDIISDDTFARLSFVPSERVRVSATYRWPMVEGVRALIRVRRRQDRGVAQIAARYPELLVNEDVPPVGLGGIVSRALQDPIGFAVYAFISLAVQLGRGTGGWERGR